MRALNSTTATRQHSRARSRICATGSRRYPWWGAVGVPISAPSARWLTPASADHLCRVSGCPQLRDDDLALTHHALHGCLSPLGIGVTEQFRHLLLNDLPGQAVLVLQPSARS